MKTQKEEEEEETRRQFKMYLWSKKITCLKVYCYLWRERVHFNLKCILVDKFLSSSNKKEDNKIVHHFTLTAM